MQRNNKEKKKKQILDMHSFTAHCFFQLLYIPCLINLPGTFHEGKYLHGNIFL